MNLKNLTTFGLLLLISTTTGLSLTARTRDNYHIKEADNLSEAEAQDYLFSIRSFSYAQDYVFRFKLKHYPPKARKITYYGTLYGHFDVETGNHWERIVIQDRDPENPQKFITTHDLLLKRGSASQVWVLKSKDASELHELSVPEIHQPLIKGITLTYFDLLAPYLYWNSFEYTGPSQVKARPSQAFKLLDPDPESPLYAVKVNLDDEFRAILKAVVIDEKENVLKSMELVSLKKTAGQYIPKTIDYRDYVQKGNKSRIEIIASAMELTLPLELFEPENLTETFPKLDSFLFDVF